MRLDQYLVSSGLSPSRARAQETIAAGLVTVNGQVAIKPAAKIAEGAEIVITGEVHPYVSRGGLKLEEALRAFEIKPKDKICLDLGASTGGFCDVLLKGGCTKVYAVDVGTGQLHEKIAQNPRIINLEKTHASDLNRTLVPDPIDIIACDVSFISLKKALPPALELTAPGAHLAALVKPQFEVGRSRVGKGGIVKPSYENSYGVIEDMSDWLNNQPGWETTGWRESPIKGGDGNQEFLLGGAKTT